MAQCEKNYIFIKPVLRAYPMKTPSPYMIADAMLIADGLLAGNLLKIPGVDEAGLQGKTSMAVMEANDIKKLIGAVRYLSRGGRSSYSPIMRELKSLVKWPPARCSRARGCADDDAGAEDDEDEDAELGQEQGHLPAHEDTAA
eukprot:3066112-Pyramimonas_sp.AAC.1